MKPTEESKSQRTPGLECPHCGCRHFYVVYTRPKADRIVRRKECRHCQRRVTTHEKLLGK